LASVRGVVHGEQIARLRGLASRAAGGTPELFVLRDQAAEIEPPRGSRTARFGPFVLY